MLIGLPNGNTWVTAQPNFIPDRRPLIIINFANGSWKGNANSNPNGSLTANYVGDVNASLAGNQFGLTDWWFGKHAQYPAVLTDTATNTKVPATTLATHVCYPWLDYPNGIAYLQAGTNSVPDQLDHLLATLDRYWLDGFRRFVLFLPGGVPFGVQVAGTFTGTDQNSNQVSIVQSFWGGHNQPMNQWQIMPQWKQVELQTRLNAWLDAHQPVPAPPSGWIDVAQIPSIELYTGSPVGSDVNDPCVQSNLWSPNVVLANQGAPPSQVNEPRWVSLPTAWAYVGGFWSSLGSVVPITPCSGSSTFDLDPREVSHLRYVWDALNPWKSAGINRFWLDAGSDNANVGGRRHLYGMLELSYNPVFAQNNFRFGAETFPVVNNGNSVDECNAHRAPWFGLLDVCATPTGPNNSWSNYTFKNWTWSRSATEAVLWVNYNSTYRQLVEARQRGYVLACANNDNANGRKLTELIKRLYGSGWIYLPDFNGDGVVEPTDLDDWRWMAQVYRPANTNIGIASYGFGDINGDGHVDAIDESALMSAINQDILSTYSVQSLWIDLGVGRLADR